ncbi:hypothetical protein Taro_027426, partial [Colocasia esculenta]|nr:hypothetical protein [Colocasia esculenta]
STGERPVLLQHSREGVELNIRGRGGDFSAAGAGEGDTQCPPPDDGSPPTSSPSFLSSSASLRKMAEKPAGPAPNGKPVLQKPPGYRDPAAPAPAGPPRPPHRKQPLPPSFRPGAANPKHYRRRRRRACCRRLCCWLCLILLIVFFVLALVGALSYLWFQPKLPSFHLQSIQTPLFNVTSKLDGSFVDARTVVRLQVSNPNSKIRFSFAPSEARVAVPGDDDDAGDVPLGTATAPGLDLGRKNSTVLRFEARAKGVMVDDGLGARLAVRLRSKTLRLAVEVRTRVALAVGGKRTGKVPVRVVCGGLPLKQLDGGASPKCTINVLKW